MIDKIHLCFDNDGTMSEHFPESRREIEPISLVVGEAQSPLHDQDALLVDRKNCFFGVFDGMGGGGGNPRRAAEVAKSTMSEIADFAGSPEEHLELFTASMEKAHRNIIEASGGYEHPGGTTATISKIIDHDNTTYLVWASVGDSRIYLNKDPGDIFSNPEQLSQDEGVGNSLFHCLGCEESAFRGLKQAEAIKVESGYRLIICTDGVTGDKEEEIIEDSELKKMIYKKEPQEAAEYLVKMARKNDDRTAIVIDIN